jgi:hypothetical protein
MIDAGHQYQRTSADTQGTLRAAGEAPGGGSGLSGDTQRDGGSGGSGRRGGNSSDDYLADLVEADGDLVSPVVVSTKEPSVKWVSRADGTREEGELDDLAAEIVGTPCPGNSSRLTGTSGVIVIWWIKKGSLRYQIEPRLSSGVV